MISHIGFIENEFKGHCPFRLTHLPSPLSMEVDIAVDPLDGTTLTAQVTIKYFAVAIA